MCVQNGWTNHFPLCGAFSCPVTSALASFFPIRICSGRILFSDYTFLFRIICFFVRLVGWVFQYFPILESIFISVGCIAYDANVVAQSLLFSLSLSLFHFHLCSNSRNHHFRFYVYYVHFFSSSRIHIMKIYKLNLFLLFVLFSSIPCLFRCVYEDTL